MNDIKKIMVPFDLSFVSEQALRFALGFITKDDTADIIAIHSASQSDDEVLAKGLEKKISDIKQAFPYARKSGVRLMLRTEPLIDTLLSAQKEHDIDLIIMGTKGSEQDEESSVTNTSRLVLQADCPVLVVPDETNKFKIEKIALVLGEEEIDDPPVLGTLLEITRRFNAQVHVLTICDEDDTYGYSATDEKNENTITYYLEKFYSHHIFQENTDVEQGILDFVKDKKIDMIAILPSNHAKKNAPSQGRLTKLLTLHTQVPLLTLD